jgi:hypothetical protein
MQIRCAILAASLGLLTTGAFAQSAPGTVPAAVPATHGVHPHKAHAIKAHRAKKHHRHHANKK